MKSNEYWLKKAGADYAYQQEQRSLHGNKSYRQQEHWLAEHLKDIAEQHKRPLRVLDFGCGFGRFARLLSKLDFVDYFGYDFSGSMVGPLLLDPPEGLAGDLGNRIRIAPSVREAYPTEEFDVVFTCSVLIHNPAVVAKQLLADMVRMIASDGELCLIENKLCSLTVRDNDWHDGCWLHDFAAYLPEHFQLTVIRQVIDDHDVYLFRRSGTTEASFLVADHPGSLPSAISRDMLFALGAERLAISIKQLEERAIVAQGNGLSQDLEEKLGYVLEELQRRKGENVVLKERIALNENFDRWLRETTNRSTLSTTHQLDPILDHAVEKAQKAIWNADQDCRYSHHDSGFDRVCHAFHQEWFGIRAAAGSLPGQKLAISASATWNPGDLVAIGERLSNLRIQAVIVHGMSVAMKILVEVLKRSGGLDVYLVWHGTTTQWIGEDERDLMSMVLELNRRGLFRGVHAIRRGMGGLFAGNYFVPQLLNMPPALARVRILSRRKENVSVLCPAWNVLRKNLYTNVLAGAISERVSSILVLARDLSFPASFGEKVRVLPQRTHAGTLDLMASVDLVSNVTVVDCHPMVNLEALAAGTPTLEGPLFLDALEDHPYKKLVRVEDAMSVSDIQRAIEQVIAVPQQEINQMLDDYRLQLTAIVRQRYLQFLGPSL